MKTVAATVTTMTGRWVTTRSSLLGAPLLLAMALVVSACSGSFEVSFGSESAPDAAVDLIESEAMLLRLELDAITDAVCDEPPSGDVGVVFECSASSGGHTVRFDVEIEPDDRIFASPTNVLAASDVPAYAESAIEALNRTNNLSLPLDSIDCGTESVVLNADDEMLCTITDPETGETFDAVLTVSDLQLGTFAVEITDAAS